MPIYNVKGRDSHSRFAHFQGDEMLLEAQRKKEEGEVPDGVDETWINEPQYRWPNGQLVWKFAGYSAFSKFLVEVTPPSEEFVSFRLLLFLRQY